MSFHDFRRRADQVRDIPLQDVLIFRGAVQDGRDRAKWHTEQGPLTVTGPKFMNWHRGQGGGGAIDLVMHLADMDFRTAVRWLELHLAIGHLAAGDTATPARHKPPSTSQQTHELRLPPPDPRMLDRVRRYLTQRRHLSASLIDPLLESGKLYADSRANAVFLLVAGKVNRPVGAELRGTGPQAWRGMAAGTRKDLGYFWIGRKGSTRLVLCESAIDAISCFTMSPDRICLSTSGVRSDPRWLAGLIARGYEIHCGFDADVPGDTAADRMLALHPEVKRLRPPAHDWNDALTTGQ